MSVLRQAALHDLPGAYRVCLQTGSSGQDASARFRNPDLLGHVFVGPYVAGQPELSLVIADLSGVGGYCLAARDTRAFEAWAERHWWPLLRRQFPASEGQSSDEEIIRLLHSPPKAPDSVVADYPAHLHIDLLPRVQGRGQGRALLDTQLGALRSGGSHGVHLEVSAANANAIGFYRHLGFADLASSGQSLLMGIRL